MPSHSTEKCWRTGTDCPPPVSTGLGGGAEIRKSHGTLADVVEREGASNQAVSLPDGGYFEAPAGVLRRRGESGSRGLLLGHRDGESSTVGDLHLVADGDLL
jgi:hypothetical protein